MEFKAYGFGFGALGFRFWNSDFRASEVKGLGFGLKVRFETFWGLESGVLGCGFGKYKFHMWD